MKRDMDLIKAILVYAEERLDKGAPLIKKENLPKTFHDVDKRVWREHCKWIKDNELAKGDTLQGSAFYITKILPKGYSLLNNEGNGNEDDEPAPAEPPPTEPTTKQWCLSILRQGRDNYLIAVIVQGLLYLTGITILAIASWRGLRDLLNLMVWCFNPK